MELQDAIGQRLDYFQELEQATRMLNHPGDSLVLQTDFLYMVERVDVCIDFLKAHVRSVSQFPILSIFALKLSLLLTPSECSATSAKQSSTSSGSNSV